MSFWLDLLLFFGGGTIIGATAQVVRSRRVRRRRKELALIERCDRQHAWVLEGDERGVFGGEPDDEEQSPTGAIDKDGVYRTEPNDIGLVSCVSKDGKQSWTEFPCIMCHQVKSAGVRQGSSKNWRCTECQDRLDRIRYCHHCKGREEPLYFLADGTFRHPWCVDKAVERNPTVPVVEEGVHDINVVDQWIKDNLP